MRKVIVVGGGEVGTLFCTFVSQLLNCGHINDDVRIHLLEKREQNQCGGKAVSFINHYTGFEYCGESDLEASKQCIDGAITKRLMYPPEVRENPTEIRFFASNLAGANGHGAVPLQEFRERAQTLSEYYAKRFRSLVNRGHLVRPEDFHSELSPADYTGVRNVSGGFRAAGGVFNSAVDFAIREAALRVACDNNIVTRRNNAEVYTVTPIDSGVRVLLRDKSFIDGDFVLLCASAGALRVVRNSPLQSPGWQYSRNAMLFLRLPPTSDATLLKMADKVNFVLKDSLGSMYACTLPPTAVEPGEAAVYFPSPTGSWIEEVTSDGSKNPVEISEEEREQRRRAIFEQACVYNPFLAEYAQLGDLVVRHVVRHPNKTRQMPEAEFLDTNGRVAMMSSPKWTNSELAALSAVQSFLIKSGYQGLPKVDGGFGPEKFDVPAISKYLHFRGLPLEVADAHSYTTKLKRSPRNVPEEHPIFLRHA